MTLTFSPATLSTDPQEVAKAMLASGFTMEQIAPAIANCQESEIFLSDCGTYQVLRRSAENGFDAPMVSLSVRRVDREPIHDWRHLQEIKNALLGKECEAFEVYPAESRLVDSANQYWLWGFPNPKVRIPVGFTERLVTDVPIPGTKQRKFGS